MNEIVATIKLLNTLNQVGHSLIGIIEHYIKIIEIGKVEDMYKEKAKQLLEGAKLDEWT